MKSDSCLATFENSDHSSGDYCSVLCQAIQPGNEQTNIITLEKIRNLTLVWRLLKTQIIHLATTVPGYSTWGGNCGLWNYPTYLKRSENSSE